MRLMFFFSFFVELSLFVYLACTAIALWFLIACVIDADRFLLTSQHGETNAL